MSFRDTHVQQRDVPLSLYSYISLSPSLDVFVYATSEHSSDALSLCSSFTFCQYPFVLSVNAKRTILKRDSEQQMILNARVRSSSRQAVESQAMTVLLFLAAQHDSEVSQ